MSSAEKLESDPEVITHEDLDVENTTEEYNSDTEQDSDTPSWRLVPDTDLYVISINGNPRFYSTSPDKAKDKIWEIIKFITNAHPDWRYYAVQVAENEFQLTRSYKWLLLQYEEVYKVIRFDKISRLEFYEDVQPDSAEEKSD